MPSAASDLQCIVDAADYVVLRSALSESDTGLAADGDATCTIDDSDYNGWAANLGGTPLAVRR